jgi:putative transposase
MLTGNPGHLRAFDYSGLHRYFLTFCTDQRHPLFIDDAAVDVVLRQILRAAEDEQFAVIAYCFMPDHVHLLVEARSESCDGLRFIKRAKQFSGFYYTKEFRHRLWQRYGFERVLRDEDDALSVARYLVENPVRAGLVASPADYKYTGSRTHTMAQILEAVGGVPDFFRSG